MPKKQKIKQNEFEKLCEELSIVNPFQITEYKPSGRIFIGSIDAVEKYDPNTWCLNEEIFEMKKEPYVKLVGEFWYCGLLQDGKILFSFSEFQEFMKTVDLSVKEIENDIIYFNPLSKTAIDKIFDFEIEVRHIGTEFGDPEDDEIYLKI